MRQLPRRLQPFAAPFAARALHTLSVFRSPRPARRAGPAAWGAAAWLIALLSSVGAYADGWSSMKGRVVISDTEFSSYSSDAEMVSAVKKQGKTTLKGEGTWTMNLMVFLKEAAGANSINIVYYDVSVKPRDQVNFSEVQVQPSQKIVSVNGVSVSKDLGFVKGHKYEVLATRVIGGKEKVYAKGVVTLK